MLDPDAGGPPIHALLLADSWFIFSVFSSLMDSLSQTRACKLRNTPATGIKQQRGFPYGYLYFFAVIL